MKKITKTRRMPKKTFYRYCSMCRTTAEMKYLNQNKELGIIWLKCKSCSHCYFFSYDDLFSKKNEGQALK
jgi:MinD superfamily P-loop ATPase